MTTAARLRVLVDADTGLARVQLAQFSSHLSNTTKAFAAMGLIGAKAFVAVGAAAVGVVGYGVAIASDLQQARIGFEAMLGSAEKADAFLRQLQEFAAKTPFRLQGVIEGSQRLLAMGFAAEQVLPTMNAIGASVSAIGGSSFEIQRVTLALGQMMAAGRVKGQELLQLQQVGIQTAEILALATGKSTAEAVELQQKGLVTAQQFIDAYIEYTGGRFTGLVEKQSQSLMGLISTFQDEVAIRLADVASPLVESFSEAIPKVQAVVLELLDTIGPSLGDLVQTIADTLLALLPVISPVFKALAETFGGFLRALIPLLGTLVPIATDLGTAFSDLLTAILPLLPPVLEIVAAFLPLVPAVVQLAAAFANGLAPALVAILQPIADVLTFLSETHVLLPAIVSLMALLTVRTFGAAAAQVVFGLALKTNSGALLSMAAGLEGAGVKAATFGSRLGAAGLVVGATIALGQTLGEVFRDALDPQEAHLWAQGIADALSAGKFNTSNLNFGLGGDAKMILQNLRPEEVQMFGQELQTALIDAASAGSITEAQMVKVASSFNNAQDAVFLNTDAMKEQVGAALESAAATEAAAEAQKELDDAATKAKDSMKAWSDETTAHFANAAALLGEDFATMKRAAVQAANEGGDAWAKFVEDFKKGIDDWRAGAIDAFDTTDDVLSQFAGKSKVNAENIAKAFEKQVDALKEYKENWRIAQQSNIRGVDQFLIALQGMGLEGAGILDAFAGASEGTQRRIVNGFMSTQGGAKDLVHVIEVDLIGAINRLIAALGGNVPKKFTWKLDLDTSSARLELASFKSELAAQGRMPGQSPTPHAAGAGASAGTGTGTRPQQKNYVDGHRVDQAAKTRQQRQGTRD